MKHASGLIAFLFLCGSTVGCSGGGDGGGADSGGGGSSGATGGTGGATGGTAGSAGATGGTGGSNACGTNVVANTVNNYSFSSTLSFPPVTVKPDSELTFDWSAVTTDFIGHPLDPMAGVDRVNVMLWKLTQEQLQEKLNADQLQQRDLAIVATHPTQKMETSAALFSFLSGADMPLTTCDFLPFLQLPNPDPNAHPECEGWADNDGFDPATHTYTAMIAAGTVLGQGTRMIQAFKLDAASTNTRVVLDPMSTHLEWSVNMHDLQPTRVPAGNGAITIDWTNMMVNALGNEFLPTSITQALVAHYSQSPSELEGQFLDLDLIDIDTWRANIEVGTSVSLDTFTNESGQPFAGIDGTGTWILALSCGDCRNPAPWYLTTLQACTP